MVGLFFQDALMQQIIAEYPEFLCGLNIQVDRYKAAIVENGNGQIEIVWIWVIANETKETISSM